MSTPSFHANLYPTDLDLAVLPDLVKAVANGDRKTATKATLYVLAWAAGHWVGEPLDADVLGAEADAFDDEDDALTWEEVDEAVPLSATQIEEVAAPGFGGVLDVLTLGRVLATVIEHVPEVAALLKKILSESRS